MGKKAAKKKNIFTPKQIFLLIIGAFLAFFLILAIALNPMGKKNLSKDEKENTNEDNSLKTVQEVIEYFESVYYSSEVSTEEGYDLDIKVSFKYNLYEGDESKEFFFKAIYERIALVTEKKSFRLIDEGKNIIIKVKCSENGIYEIIINNETDYFKKEDSRRSAKKNFKAEVLDLSIDSDILKDLISAGWHDKNLNLGTKDGSYYKYDIYFDEGYEIRNIQGTVYNIVFTKNYEGYVVEDFKVGTSLEKVEARLGKTYEETGLLGYKTSNFYVWFSEDEISIYPIFNRIDYSEFEELAKEYNEKKDPNEFMYKITDVWQDYDLYEYNSNYVKIAYANKGVQFEYSVENPVGIKLYENYKGNMRDNISDYPNIFYSFDKNLTGEREVARRDKKVCYDDGDPEEDAGHYSSKFQVLCEINNNNQYSKVKIQSRDGKYPNNEFDEILTITGYVWVDDYTLIYGVSNDGIFKYDARTGESERIISGDEMYVIKDYNASTRTLTYDDKGVKFDF